MHCLVCQGYFKYRYLLRQHMSRDHRAARGLRRRRGFDQPQPPPDLVTAASVLRLYQGIQPSGHVFAAEAFPLVKVRYVLAGGGVATVISSYTMIKQLFPRELCEYWMSRSTFVAPTQKQ